jgi:hypothetical protein
MEFFLSERIFVSVQLAASHTHTFGSWQAADDEWQI